MKTVLFHRQLRKFQGGHLKAFHYFTHVLAAPGWTARVRFTEDSVWDERNPWREHRDHVVGPDEPCEPDVLFLGGRDWERIPESEWSRPGRPVLNLIQHTRHGFPDDPRHRFLANRAVRICCSQQVNDSISPFANGPVITNRYGLDPAELPKAIPFADKPVDLFIAALKQPRLGRRLRLRLWRPGRRIDLQTEAVLRSEFLDRVNRARVTLFLPHEDEGFFIPALEGMALDTLVVCPDCVGNRDFCRPGENAFRPAFHPAAIRRASEEALRLPAPGARRLLDAAAATFADHHIDRERKRFHEILADLDRLW
jgi:hypothetical protein